MCGPSERATIIARGIDFEYRTTGDQEFNFKRCAGCGCLFLDPRPIDSQIGALYPAEYLPYHFHALPPLMQQARDLVQKRKATLARRLAPEGARVVDVGCGGGALLTLLRKFGRKSWRLAGWDFPGPHLERLRAAGMEVSAAPLSEAFAPASVDLFILNQVIEHFPRPDELVATLAAALKPGGHLLIETPNVDGLDAQLFRHRYWGGYHFPRHMVLFNESSLSRLLARAGLHVSETESLASPSFWIQSLHHFCVEHAKPLAALFQVQNVFAFGVATAFDLALAPFRPTTNLRVVATKSTT